MNIISPKISQEPTLINDFSANAQEFLVDETPISDIKCSEGFTEDGEFHRIEIQKSIFDKCTFANCNFENATFIDVVFQACDVSNSKFRGAYFERCEFVAPIVSMPPIELKGAIINTFQAADLIGLWGVIVKQK